MAEHDLTAGHSQRRTLDSQIPAALEVGGKVLGEPRSFLRDGRLGLLVNPTPGRLLVGDSGPAGSQLLDSGNLPLTEIFEHRNIVEAAGSHGGGPFCLRAGSGLVVIPAL